LPDGTIDNSKDSVVTLLIVEPGFQAYKERIIKELYNTESNLVFVIGLESIIDYTWLDHYSSNIIRINYRDPNCINIIISELNKRNIQISGALTLIDPSIRFVIQLQKKLKIPVSTSFEDLADKGFVRERIELNCPEYNPKFSLIDSASPNISIRFHTNKMIIKPTNMMASLGVQVVRNEHDIANYLKAYSNIDFKGENLREIYPHLSSTFIIEDYIEGQEFSVESAICDGKITLLGVSKKEVIDSNEIGDTFPITPSSTDEQDINLFLHKVHNALEFKNGITHIEFKKDLNNRIKLIEFNGRIAGDYMLDLLKLHIENFGEVATAAYRRNSNVTPRRCNSINHAYYDVTDQEGILRYLQPLEESFISRKFLVNVGDLIVKQEPKDLNRIYEAVVQGESPKKLAVYEIQAPLFKRKTRSFELVTFEARQEDLDLISQIEKKAWNKYHAATKNELEKRIKGTNSNFYIAYNSELLAPAGFIHAVKLPEDHQGLSWSEIKDFAYKKVTNPAYLYLVSISVPASEYRGTAQAFLSGLSDHAKKEGLSLSYGMRIPYYSRFAIQGLQVEEYVEGVLNGTYIEPGLFAALKAGGKIKQIIPEYYDDPESMNYGVLIRHE
jgi:hypothetical protein